MLHQTDIHARLAAALDGHDAWIQWDLARAIARNIKFKLEDPPKRPVVTRMYDRALSELKLLFNTFPHFPEHWMVGDRIDDPSVRCLDFEMTMYACLILTCSYTPLSCL